MTLGSRKESGTLPIRPYVDAVVHQAHRFSAWAGVLESDCAGEGIGVPASLMILARVTFV